MKTAIILLLGLAFLLYIGNLKIQLSPFTVSFSEWRNALGLLFLILSLSFFQLHHKREGRNEFIKELNKDLKSENIKLIVKD